MQIWLLTMHSLFFPPFFLQHVWVEKGQPRMSYVFVPVHLSALANRTKKQNSTIKHLMQNLNAAFCTTLQNNGVRLEHIDQSSLDVSCVAQYAQHNKTSCESTLKLWCKISVYIDTKAFLVESGPIYISPPPQPPPPHGHTTWVET